MTWVDALSICEIPKSVIDVTRVTNINIACNRPMGHNPRPSVRSVSLTADLNVPVSICSKMSIPKPTSIRFGDVRPKPFWCNRFSDRRSRTVSTMTGKISHRLPFNVPAHRIILARETRSSSAPTLAQSYRDDLRRCVTGLSQYGLPHFGHLRGFPGLRVDHIFPHRRQETNSPTANPKKKRCIIATASSDIAIRLARGSRSRSSVSRFKMFGILATVSVATGSVK